MHHRAYFILEDSSAPTFNQFIVDSKDFLPHRNVDWLKNPIPRIDTFEEGNMANILPTIQFDISVNPRVTEHIILGASCTPKEVTSYKSLFQVFHDVFYWYYIEMISLTHTLLNTILTHR